MFREMRRKKQILTPEKSIEILKKGTSGVLALSGDDGYPYAKEGHKIDAIRTCDKASFCVVEQDHIVPPKYTTYYRSAIAFGRIRILEDEKEVRRAAWLLAVRYYPEDTESGRQEEINKYWKSLCMMEFSIEHLTGKESIELR